MKTLSVWVVFAYALAIASNSASAGLTINLSSQLNSDRFDLPNVTNPSPRATPFYLQAVISDSSNSGLLASNQASFLLSASGLLGDENVKDWYFNYSGDLSKLSFGFSTLAGTVSDPTFETGPKAKAAGNQFSFAFAFANGGPGRLGASESILITVTRSDGSLSSNDFSSLTSGYMSAAHIRSIGESSVDGVLLTGESDWIAGTPIPEPSSLLMALTGLFATGLLARRRR